MNNPAVHKPRNRKKLKARAAWWAHRNDDTYEVALSKRLYGYDIMRGVPGAEPKGILPS